MADGRPPVAPQPRFDVLGVQVSAMSLADAVASIAHRAIRQRGDPTLPASYVCVTGVHGVMESRHDPALRDIHNRAAMVTPDGMPLVWLGRLLGHRYMTRVYGPDLMLELCALSQAVGLRHFFYGGGDGTADLLSRRLAAHFPELDVVGTYTPPFRPLQPEERQAVIALIERSGADIVWVGLSTPKQERWMAEIAPALHAPVLIGVGAAFDFHAGLKPQAPRWMQRNGLEWLFRLASEPRRLWRRYLASVGVFPWLVAWQLIQGRMYPTRRQVFKTNGKSQTLPHRK